MPETTKRAVANRNNSSKSTGPKTPEGKAASRRNALKHGLRAEVLALPCEDPAELAAKEQFWHDHFQPQGPEEQYLLNLVVRASVQLDRCARFQAAEVAKQ